MRRRAARHLGTPGSSNSAPLLAFSPPIPTSPAAPPRPHPLTQVEKYRPSNIKDVVGNEEAVARLRVIAEEGNMPNLILAVSCQAGCTRTGFLSQQGAASARKACLRRVILGRAT